MTELLSALASVGTAIGVLVAAWQLLLAHRQSVTNFEDSFAQEYRELATDLPTKALLGEELSEDEYKDAFDEFYHYFDLCNEQAFHHQIGRITPSTWTFWRDGMQSNFARPAFKRAWQDVCSRSGKDFAELRALFPCDTSRQLPNDRNA